MIVAKLSSILYPFGCSCFWRNVLSNTSMRGRVIHTFSVQLFWLFLHIQQLPVYIIIWPLFYMYQWPMVFKSNTGWVFNALVPVFYFLFYLLDSSYEAWRAVSETLLFLVFLSIQYISLLLWMLCIYMMRLSCDSHSFFLLRLDSFLLKERICSYLSSSWANNDDDRARFHSFSVIWAEVHTNTIYV